MSEESQNCPDCGREECWGGQVCQVIKKDREEKEAIN